MASDVLHGRTTSPVLEGLEPVRKRPGMYIGGIDTHGYHHLLWEIVDNSVDEVINGHATRDRGHARTRTARRVTVDDNGRGIPVDMHAEAQEAGARAHPHHAARRRQVRQRQLQATRAACTASARRSSTRCPRS